MYSTLLVALSLNENLLNFYDLAFFSHEFPVLDTRRHID